MLRTTITVGRWMCRAEFALMLATGTVQESFSGTTHVLLPPDPASFRRQAKSGDLYVEFEGPSVV
ncbi:TreTu family toxin [Duganella sp. PWIR1]